MIVAIEGLIPDRRAVPAQNKTAPPPVNAQIYKAAWLRKQPGETIDPQPDPALAQEEDEPARPASPGVPGACRGTSLSPPVPARRGNPLPARPETSLRLTLSLTPASPPSPTALNPSQRPTRRLMPACPLQLRTNGSLPR